jgi:transposase
VVYQSDGAVASSLTARHALLEQQSGCILATKALDHTPLPPHEVLEAYKGQAHAERGCRFLKAPPFFAAALSRKKPERIMARLMVMTVCVLGYAAVAYRLRQALKDHEATLPDQQGKRLQHPTARGVLHCFMGIHWLYQGGQWPMVLNLTEKHQHLLRLLGPSSMWFYDVKYS